MGFLRRKKKPKKIVIITLEREGESMDVEMKAGKMIHMLKIAKKLISLGKKGWELKDITGDPGTVGMFKSVLSGYKTGDKPPVKKMLKAAGLQTVPSPIKKLLRKDKEENESKDL